MATTELMNSDNYTINTFTMRNMHKNEGEQQEMF